MSYVGGGLKRRYYLFIVLFCLVGLAGCASTPGLLYSKEYSVKINDDAKEPAFEITYLGNTSLYFEGFDNVGLNNVMVDGFVSRPGRLRLLFGGLKYDNLGVVDEVLAKANINEIGIVAPLHAHFDHFLDAPYIAREKNGKLFASETSCIISEKMGYEVVCDNGEVIGEEGGGFRVEAIPTEHVDTGGWPASKFAPVGIKYSKSLRTDINKRAKAKDYVEGDSRNIQITHSSGIKVFVIGGFTFGDEDFSRLLESDIVFLSIPVVKESHKRGKIKELFAALDMPVTKKKDVSRTIIPVHWDDFTKKLDFEECERDKDKCLHENILIKCWIDVFERHVKKFKSSKVVKLTAFGKLKAY